MNSILQERVEREWKQIADAVQRSPGGLTLVELAVATGIAKSALAGLTVGAMSRYPSLIARTKQKRRVSGRAPYLFVRPEALRDAK